jgi:hypothetical protein
MVKARGYQLLPVTQLKLGVDLRGFSLTIGISVNPEKVHLLPASLNMVENG